MLFYKIFNYVYFALLVGIGLFSFVSWNSFRKGFKLLSVFILITLFVEIAARWMLKEYGQNNAVYILYDILNVTITALVLAFFMVSKKNKLIIFIADAVLVIYYLFDVIFLNRYVIDYSVINCIISIFLCFFSCMFLLDKIEIPRERVLHKTPEFLFSISLLFFCSVSVLYWIIFLQFKDKEGKAITSLMYKFFLISNIIYYSGIFLVLVLETKNPEKENEGKYT